MTKPHQVIRTVLLVLFPFILGLTPYLALTKCINVETSAFIGKSASCGWPFPYETVHAGYLGKWGKWIISDSMPISHFGCFLSQLGRLYFDTSVRAINDCFGRKRRYGKLNLTVPKG
jgi:hypothetical protein